MKKVLSVLKNQRGDLKTFITVIGLAVVSVLIIAGTMIYAPDTAESFWEQVTSYAKDTFGF